MAQGAPSTFNELHTTFVTTEDGTTLQELLQVLGSISLTPILVPLLLPWIVPPSFVQQAVLSNEFFSLVRAILEYPFLILLPIWIVTIFAGENPGGGNGPLACSGVVFVTMACIPLCILIVNNSVTAPKWLGLWNHWNKIKNLPTGWSKPENVTEEKNEKEKVQKQKDEHEKTKNPSPKIPFITNYRAIVIYITILCIIAVDFSIFPRRFSKTKTYGISLMDVGTGCFVFANGVVAPEARNRLSPLSHSLKSTVPIILLGFVRLITVKGIEYQEVVEEYGVHWNFFFTLAGVKILSSLLFTYFHPSQSLKMAFFVGFAYEALLNMNDFQNTYILNPDIRRGASLLNANREGVFSVLGYLVIYLGSVYFGKIIYFKRRVSVMEWTHYAFQSFLQVMLLWLGYAVSTTFGNMPCRRSANLSYVLLMVALNYTLMWFQMFLTLVQVCLQHLGLIYGPMIFYELTALQAKEKNKLSLLQKMTKDFVNMKRKKKPKTEDEEYQKELDEKLESLEDQLEEAVEVLKREQKEGKINAETVQKLMSIEDEIQKLEETLRLLQHQEQLHSDSDSESQSGQDSSSKMNVQEKQRNLVLLPDLSKAPVILESFCYNGLFTFLLGNLLTGLINCTIYTMYTPPYLSLCYLWLYSTVITSSSVALYWYRIQLKFW